MLTDRDAYEIKKRANSATPGKWATKGNGDTIADWMYINAHRPQENKTFGLSRLGEIERPICGDGYNGRSGGVISTKADADFIAHAREDVPTLVDAWFEQNYLLKEILDMLEADAVSRDAIAFRIRRELGLSLPERESTDA